MLLLFLRSLDELQKMHASPIMLLLHSVILLHVMSKKCVCLIICVMIFIIIAFVVGNGAKKIKKIAPLKFYGHYYCGSCLQ